MNRVKRSVELWVLSPLDEVLLLHVHTSALPFWQPITGGIKAREEAAEAAVRELAEETRLRLHPNVLKPIANGVRVRINDSLEIDKTIFVGLHERAPVTVNPTEHDESQWVPSSEVAGKLYWPSNLETWALVRAASPARAPQCPAL